MSAIGFIYISANVILLMALFAVIESNWPDSWAGRAIGVLHSGV